MARKNRSNMGRTRETPRLDEIDGPIVPAAETMRHQALNEMKVPGNVPAEADTQAAQESAVAPDVMVEPAAGDAQVEPVVNAEPAQSTISENPAAASTPVAPPKAKAAPRVGSTRRVSAAGRKPRRREELEEDYRLTVRLEAKYRQDIARAVSIVEEKTGYVVNNSDIARAALSFYLDALDEAYEKGNQHRLQELLSYLGLPDE